MKMNNKGFFLAETIIVIALITTVMAYVFPNVSKIYENYKYKAKYYDQTQDIYTLRAVYNYLLNEKYSEYNNESALEIVTTINKNESDDEALTYCYNYGVIGSRNIPDTLIKLFDSNNSNNILAKDVSIGFLNKLYIVSYINNGISGVTTINQVLKSSGSTTNNYVTIESSPSEEDLTEGLKRYLNRMKKKTYDTASYRLIGVFNETGQIRYASIKVVNPNPNRQCNLGGA